MTYEAFSVEFEYVPDIYLASYSFGKQLVTGGISWGQNSNSPFYISASWQDLQDIANNPLGNIDAGELEEVFSGLSDSVSSVWINGALQDSSTGSYVQDEAGVLIYAGEGQGNYNVGFSFVGLEAGEYRKELGSEGNFFVYDTLNGEYLAAHHYFAPQSIDLLVMGMRSVTTT